jgi:hypothetical protein
MTNRLLAGCLSLLVAAAAGSAAAQAPQASPVSEAPVAAPAPADEKKVCRREKSASGTRVGTGRICKTQAEWDKLKAKASAEKAKESRGGA